MSSSRRIITSGTALVLSPQIKQHFGTSAALVLQQLHYWLSKENLSYGIIDELGYQWIRNSYEQWREQIQVLTLSTLRRAFSLLEEKNIILSKRFSDKSKYAGGSQVKYFTINYTQLESVLGDLGKTAVNRPSHFPSAENRAGDKPLNMTVDTSHNHAQLTNNSLAPKEAINPLKQTNHLFKMNTLSVQNEHPVYISNITSQNTSLSKTPKQITNNTAQAAEHEAIQPDKPAEREINTLSKEMILVWNESVGENNPDKKIALTPKRIQHLNAAFKQFFENDLSNWEAFCHKITTCKFLMGEKAAFKANLDWAIRFENIQKIREGAFTFGTRESKYTLKLNGESHQSSSEGLNERIAKPALAIRESSKALAIREKIKQKIDRAEYLSWFLPTEISVETNEDGCDHVTLCVKTRFMGDRIKTTYRDIYEQYFSNTFIGSAEQYLTSKNDDVKTTDRQETSPAKSLLENTLKAETPVAHVCTTPVQQDDNAFAAVVDVQDECHIHICEYSHSQTDRPFLSNMNEEGRDEEPLELTSAFKQDSLIDLNAENMDLNVLNSRAFNFFKEKSRLTNDVRKVNQVRRVTKKGMNVSTALLPFAKKVTQRISNTFLRKRLSKMPIYDDITNQHQYTRRSVRLIIHPQKPPLSIEPQKFYQPVFNLLKNNQKANTGKLLIFEEYLYNQINKMRLTDTIIFRKVDTKYTLSHKLPKVFSG